MSREKANLPRDGAGSRTKTAPFASSCGNAALFAPSYTILQNLTPASNHGGLKGRLKWFKFENEEVILRLVFDTPLTEECWLRHSDSANSLHSLIGCTPSAGTSSRDGPIRVIQPYINSLDALRKSIESCQQGHSCMQETENRRPPLSIPNLLLIDCLTRKVVTAPHRCWYLALSYVWGNQKSRPVNIRERLSSLPQTIEDAVTVTVKLGFHYLWVDMYCIKQDNEKDVDNQIRHMDLVYRRAQATIVAAAGKGPNFGLPGVSSGRRARQAHATIDGISIASFIHNPWELVDSSTWNSRAWTFQESLFSPRRIFFTAEQTIFNCSFSLVMSQILG